MHVNVCSIRTFSIYCIIRIISSVICYYTPQCHLCVFASTNTSTLHSVHSVEHELWCHYFQSVLYVACSNLCRLQYSMSPAVLYVTWSIVCCLEYCMLPAVLYVTCSTVCHLQYCMSPAVFFFFFSSICFIII